MEMGQIAEMLDGIAQNVGACYEIGAALRARDLADQNDPLWKFVFAFQYMYVSDSNIEYRGRYGPFAPFVEMGGRVFPPPLSTIDDETLAFWNEVLEKAKTPLICSRLADLLWVRNWSERPDLYAKKAIDSYLQQATREKIEFEHVNYLVRALELAREINDSGRKGLVIAALIHAATQEMESGENRPGISLTLIEALMGLPKEGIPNEVDNLLETALKVYEGDAWILENVLELVFRRVNPAKKKEIRKLQVDNWIAEAEKESSKGIVRLAHLEHALELARNYGFQDIADEIRHKIQSMPEDELGLKTVSASVEIPQEELEKFLNSFVAEKGWKESLMRFGIYGPPSGDYKNNIEVVEQESQKFPLQFVITRSIHQENNVPVRIGKDLEENKAIAVVNHETMGIRMFGRFAPEILLRINTKHGAPTVQELTEFFSTVLIPKDIAENIAISIDWYNKGEYDICAHLIVPRLEAIIRIIAREIGLVIIQEPQGNRPGGVVQLGNLLIRMQERMDESWRRYFYNVLANPIGVNLRNRICHGMLPKATQDDAGLLIHVACHLRLMEIKQNPPEDAPKDETQLH